MGTDAAERAADAVVDQKQDALQVERPDEQSDEGVDDSCAFGKRTRLLSRRARTLST